MASVRKGIKQKHQTVASIRGRRKLHPLPLPDSPEGVPRAVMRELAQSGLSNDAQAFNLKLQQLLVLHQTKGA